jgi:hypothetical protein
LRIVLFTARPETRNRSVAMRSLAWRAGDFLKGCLYPDRK